MTEDEAVEAAVGEVAVDPVGVLVRPVEEEAVVGLALDGLRVTRVLVGLQKLDVVREPDAEAVISATGQMRVRTFDEI